MFKITDLMGPDSEPEKPQKKSGSGFNGLLSGMITATRTVKGDCYSTEWCPKCDKRIQHSDVMYNSGVCPHCGNASGSTVCDYVIKAYRVIRHQKQLLWFLWVTVDKEYELVQVTAR